MDCEQVKTLLQIDTQCCDHCHTWMEKGIVRGYLITHKETQYEVCCNVMGILDKRNVIGECKNGIFDLRI